MVLMRVTASAPASSAARAIAPMSATFGESFTHSGFPVAARTRRVRPDSPSGFEPKAIPPSFTLGQEAFSSIAASAGRLPESRRATASYSSIVRP